MLPAAHRLRQSADFSRILQQRHRAGRATVVVNLGQLDPRGVTPPRVGLIVGKNVGGSVVRHRVSRRLRAQLADQVERMPRGYGVVVRALPAAAAATSADLRRDLVSAIGRLTRSPLGGTDG